MNEFVLEKEANRFRQENGLSSTDPIRLKSLLQQLQVVTIFSELSADFSGMALKVKEHDKVMRFMLINTNQSLGKQHFTICHELYHLFIQIDFVSRVCQTGRYDKRDPEEYYALRMTNWKKRRLLLAAF
jgi:Zn-dependent peptidase ImmA (M78 family)